MLRIRGACCAAIAPRASTRARLGGASPDEGIRFNALGMLINLASATDVELGDRA